MRTSRYAQLLRMKAQARSAAAGTFIEVSSDAAMKENTAVFTHRLKDPPNMTFHLETLFNESGIKDENMLRILGAKMCWLRLRQSNPC